ncbi:MAG: zf-HC2 domain-containing protein [Lachnospiraceae bacterium]|jgi:hypothetical protein|nr:zf-HC2 domain-containing protein [Lachnospiraceae bacterium]
MNCLEAQSNIISYIENGLEKEKRIDFLRHIQSCKDCKEELDIYYTMIEGMRQMDSNAPISKDFKKELDIRINRELKQNKTRKEFVISSIVIAVICLFAFSVVGYVNFLGIVKADEQRKLKEAQGEYYYSDTFDKYLFEPDNQVITINIEPEPEEEQSFYSKIRAYNVLR